jgi:carbon-monoxide dehydrogenase medium subunit
MEYIQPKSIREALHIMRQFKNRAKIIAGGTNVIPDMRIGAIKPDVLVDITCLKSLSYIKEEKKRVKIGSLTTVSGLKSSRIVQDFVPILCDAAQQLGNPLVRNRATIGGNLADASPAADTAVPLLVLGATVITEKEGGKGREIPIDQFFLGPNQTVLKPEEIIREILIPKPDLNSRMFYLKLGLRNAMAISVVSVAILMEIENDVCKKARVALGAVSPKPMRANGVEEILKCKKITGDLVEKCCQSVEEEVQPITDIRASAQYRRSMASVLLRRLIIQVLSEGSA